MTSSAKKINESERYILAITGGVGGAKLALGLSEILHPGHLAISVNTGDDFEHLGLPISPDLDTLMYTLAGIADPEKGWGIENETWNFMQATKQLGGESWFNLGDKDMATHIRRRELISQGKTLTETTQILAQELGIQHLITPMTDAPVHTLVHTSEGTLPFQHYFVREQCKPVISGFTFAGSEMATAHTLLTNLANDERLAGIIICPSNPFVSIAPFLALPDVQENLRSTSAPVIAVSPIVNKEAVKGPTAKMMQELKLPISSTSIAQYYEDIIDGIIIDKADIDEKSTIENLGLNVKITNTLMPSLDAKINLAINCIDFLLSLKQ